MSFGVHHVGKAEVADRFCLKVGPNGAGNCGERIDDDDLNELSVAE